MIVRRRWQSAMQPAPIPLPALSHARIAPPDTAGVTQASPVRVRSCHQRRPHDHRFSQSLPIGSISLLAQTVNNLWGAPTSHTPAQSVEVLDLFSE